MTTRHDVVIVGGGLVGASLAIALDRIGVDVGLVDAGAPGSLPAVFDERNLSFAEATVQALRALGVMQKLRQPTGPIRRIHVTRQGDFGRLRLDAGAHGRETFGEVVVARDFGHALEARLQEASRVTRYRPCRFVSSDEPGDGVRRIRLCGEAGPGDEAGPGGAARECELVTPLLVAADGTRSMVRDALGIEVDEHDYGQDLLVARVRAERPPDGTAYERFRDDGPTAFLPRGDRHFGSVHAVPRAQSAAIAALDDAAYLQRLQQAFGWRVGKLLSVGARAVYPALALAARRTVGARAVLVGNAAQTLHPVGAQGFNLGLRDALMLAELIDASRADPGSEALLDDHVRRRAEDRARTMAFSDGLARVTANPAPGLRPLRSLGLLALDGMSSLQASLVGGAMGYRGDVPALCRGPRP